MEERKKRKEKLTMKIKLKKRTPEKKERQKARSLSRPFTLQKKEEKKRKRKKKVSQRRKERKKKETKRKEKRKLHPPNCECNLIGRKTFGRKKNFALKNFPKKKIIFEAAEANTYVVSSLHVSNESTNISPPRTPKKEVTLISWAGGGGGFPA